MIDSVYGKDNKAIILKCFFGKCKYVVREKNMSTFVIDGTEIHFDEENSNDPGDFDVEDSNEKIQMEKK